MPGDLRETKEQIYPMSRKKRGILRLATIFGLLLPVLGCLVFPSVQRRHSTARLVQAVIHTDEVAVRAALANGADPNAPPNYTSSITLRDIPRLLFHQTPAPENGQTLMMFAAGNCDAGILQALLDAGGNVNYHDASQTTSLMFAIAMGQ
ncbi:MAG: hypothetical protein JWN14_3666, partial [Chthonomonadales bacterium]|nr:hypothetical protein [Chthonomonadales bacterium]